MNTSWRGARLVMASEGESGKPMSEAGKAAIKEGLRKYHENRKKTAQPVVPPPAASGERSVAKPTKKSQASA